jgi:hypothetical protein
MSRKPRQLDPVSSDWETEETRQMDSQQLYKHRENIMAGMETRGFNDILPNK